MATNKTYDHTIVKEVRNKVLAEILDVLKESPKTKKYSDFKKQMLLKLAPTVLPRVNEHSGLDGDPIQQSIVYLPAKANEKRMAS